MRTMQIEPTFLRPIELLSQKFILLPNRTEISPSRLEPRIRSFNVAR